MFLDFEQRARMNALQIEARALMLKLDHLTTQAAEIVGADHSHHARDFLVGPHDIGRLIEKCNEDENEAQQDEAQPMKFSAS